MATALDEIKERFVDAFDESEASFDAKVASQFEGTSENARIVFANVEYLWAMPMENIAPETKRSYAKRWFPGPNQVVRGDLYFFGYPHTIANPGPWYLRNKYWELVAALRILSLITTDSELKTISMLKQRIVDLCHAAIYRGIPAGENFTVNKVCGIHSALMHLANPEKSESIISTSHRKQICAVFGHVIASPPSDEEVMLKEIRKAIFYSHGYGDDPDKKYRWFFYCKDLRSLWMEKKTKQEQRLSSALFDVRNEEDAAEIEGNKDEVTGYRIRRSAKLVRATKERDGHSCRACGFYFEDQIVHVHHLDPLSEYNSPQETKLGDLLTLCPTCHYLAHYWLRKSDRYKKLDPLLSVLKKGRQ
jgi:predicted HNH restriction endonuclease